MTLQSAPHGQSFDRRAIPARARESYWYADDGYPIRRIDWPEPDTKPHGSILFMPGRGDSYEKYLETLEHWRRKGWTVVASDWRGQAFSGRLGRDGYTGHIDDFATWTADLAVLWQQWKLSAPAPHVLVGHSMGAHLILRATAEDLVAPDALVMTAPMLGLHPAFVPVWLLQSISGLMVRLGDPRRPAWKWSEKPWQPPEDRIRLLTHDPERYADELWWREERPELAMGPASWSWLHAAFASIRFLEKPGLLESVRQPVFIVEAIADALVDYRAIERAAARIPNARLLRFGREARHEILREEDPVRDKALAAIDAFLDRVVPQAA